MRRILLISASLLLGAFMTWLAFRGTDWRAVLDAVGEAHPLWLVGSVAFLSVATVIRAARWNIFVRATVIVTHFRHVLAAVCIDQLAQMALPLKAGLFVRSVAFSRMTEKPLPLVYGTATFDRVPELVTLSVFVVIAILGLPGQSEYVIGADVFDTADPVILPGDVLTGLVGLVATAVTIRVGLITALYLKRDAVIRGLSRLAGMVSDRAAERVGVLLGHFADALRLITSWRDLARALALTMVFWLCFMAAHACTLAAFGLATSWQAPMLMFVLTAVSMAMPGAPGFVGQWHLAVVGALVIAQPGLPPAEMKAVALVSHILQVGLVSIMGATSLFFENMAIGDLKSTPVTPREPAEERP